MKKRKLAAAMLISMLTVALCACGGNDSSEDDVTPTVTEGVAEDFIDEGDSTAETNQTNSMEDEETVDNSHTANSVPEAKDISEINSIISGRVEVSGTDFVVDDEVLFINGVNTPWDNWNDCGGKFDKEFWSTHFAELKEAGVNAARVWISCNGANIDIQDDGYVNGPTEAFWTDLDELMTCAEENGIYIMATVMSFDNFKDEGQNYMAWRTMLDSDEAIDSYVDNYIIPLCERYKDYNSLWSIDLCNEPDWIYENEECGQIDWKRICTLFAKSAAAIHENSDILVTVGFGIIKYNSENYNGNYGSDEYLQSLYENENAYLDFYEPHYYEWELTWFGFPFDTDTISFGLDGTKPVVLGEFPATGMESEGYELTGGECYVSIYENGWNGIMAWTSNGVDSCGDLSMIIDGVKQVAEMMNGESGE